MNKLYNISKGQLITLWVFEIWLLFWATNQDDMGSNWAGLVGILTATILVFYSIGWRNNKNKLG